MIVLRTPRETDLNAVYKIAKNCGVGMTSLPNNKELLQKRIESSIESFAKNKTEPKDEYYLFILEDVANKTVIGTSAIQAKTGVDSPLYSYHLSRYTRHCSTLNIRSEYDVLNLVNDNQGHSEICTLYLDPKYRKHHNGLLLSKARFLFIAQNPSYFAQKLIAELRGEVNKRNLSPFWENVGHHFFQMSFNEADQLYRETNRQFVEDLMPQHPIYVPLLSLEAQEAIGKPHHATLPARHILEREGFRFNNYVHIFDAGPILEVQINDIKTVAMSQERIVAGLSDEVKSIEYMIANTRLDFRATTNFAVLHESENTCIISKATAELLDVKVNDTVRLSPLMQPDITESK